MAYFVCAGPHFACNNPAVGSLAARAGGSHWLGLGLKDSALARHGSANGPREADLHSAKSRADRRPKGILELVWQSEVVRLHVSDGSSHRQPACAHRRWLDVPAHYLPAGGGIRGPRVTPQALQVLHTIPAPIF
jgi:hypothetical protein